MKSLCVLVACEESQEVCTAFRKLGHMAFSCDIQPCSGGHPEWHFQDDVLNYLNDSWDLIIAHPPCTYLSTAATQCHSIKVYSKDQIAERTMKRIKAMEFFMRFVNADCKHIAIENPVGVMSACYRKPDQYIHPYYFAKSEADTINYVTKKTGLWLKGLPCLSYNCKLPNPMENAEIWKNGKKKNWTESNHGSVIRSKTFPGIAEAMATQWSDFILKELDNL